MTSRAWSRFADRMAAAMTSHLAGGTQVRPPDGGTLFWEAFADLNASRRLGPAGPDPLSLAEVQAWAAMNGTPLAPHHVAVIRALDRAWLDHVRTRRAPEGVKTVPAMSTGALTPNLFDLSAFGGAR